MTGKKLIAGPCSAESEEQLLKTAEGLAGLGVEYFRAGLWKPRTRPGCFEGVGEKGLGWMRKVKEEFGMKIGTEVAFKEHVRLCLDAGFDMVWLGARTTSNPFLVQEIADELRGSETVVFVKNPINPDVDLWIGAIERLKGAGVSNIGTIHRGFSSYEKIKYRNAPGWQIVTEFRRRCPDVPVYCDPSHLAGSRELIPEVCQWAMDLGFDGLMIESHYNPSSALSDARQQFTPQDLGLLLEKLVEKNSEIQDDDLNVELSGYRSEIDAIDEQILEVLGKRMEVSRALGSFKKEHNVSVIQKTRWDEVLSAVSSNAEKYGLHEEFVKSIFNLIHDASIEEQ